MPITIQDDEAKSVADAAGCLALFVVVLPVGIVWWAFVTRTVWNWWVPPAFGLPALTIVQALAIGFVRSAIWWNPQKAKKDETAWDIIQQWLASNVIGGSFAMLVAWLAAVIAF